MEVETTSSGLLPGSLHLPALLTDDHSHSTSSIFSDSCNNNSTEPTKLLNGTGVIGSGNAKYGETPETQLNPGNSLLQLLYSKDSYAKIWSVAAPALAKSNPPTLYPEYVLPNSTKYIYRELEFWTSGFFPGSLYLLLERERVFNPAIRALTGDDFMPSNVPHSMQLEFACKWWTTNLHQNAALNTTHDLGFMIFPWARLAWTLDHDALARDTIIRASKTLASRYVPSVGAIRSWDTCVTKRYSFTDPTADALVIIDNMMNLDMMFWAASQLNDSEMYQIALNHARTTQAYHVRADYSTTHLVVFDPDTGALKSRLTNQGYSDESSWARGQAWAISGFAQTYTWTRDVSFLETSQHCADYFLDQLPAGGVPPWDFSAPRDREQPPDTSAAMIAAYGMLLIHEARLEQGEATERDYFQAAVDLMVAVLSKHYNAPAKFVTSHVDTLETVERLQTVESQMEVRVKNDGLAETILGGATINNYEFAPRRWANHGLVYADYYFLLVGNKLLEMKAATVLKDVIVPQV